jgi:hypothetical protein
MTGLESWQNTERQNFGPGNQGEAAGLSRSVQSFYQPIERTQSAENLPWALDFGTGADLYQSAAYTGERLSARIFMADETEQKLDAPKIQAPSDALTRPSVIRTKEDEAIWDEMQKPHKLGKHESATHIGLTPEVIAEMQAKGQASKLEFFDSAAEGALAALQKPQKEQTLIASNIAPNVPNLEQMQQYQDVQSDTEPPKLPELAQTRDGYMPPPTLVPSLEQLGMTPETIKALAKAAADLVLPWTKDHPLAERENDLMAQALGVNPRAWEDAKGAFPQLANVSTNVMQAYTRNEITNYDRLDLKDDLDAATGKLSSAPGRPANQATLGITQISPKGIGEFEQKYPQFKQFLESKGYTGPGHEIAALLDPECAPMIVAAKTASIVEDMQKHGIQKPTSEQIAYAYNPDVYSFSNGQGGKEYKALYQAQIKLEQMLHPDLKKEYYATIPEVIKNSAHVHNVMSKMK